MSKQYIKNFIINIDNFSIYSFMRMQQINGGPDDIYPIGYLDIMDEYKTNYYTHRNGNIEDEDEDINEYTDTDDYVEDPILFRNFKEFHKHNIECVDKLSDQEARFIILICKHILDKSLKIHINSTPWNSRGIYFNKQGKLIITHPR